MAEPIFKLEGNTFVFSNEGVTIKAAATDIVPPDSITIESVTLTNHHDTFTLPVADFVVPLPVAEHVFDLLI
jgi:hypothetical protein